MTGAERVKKYREQNPKKVELLQLRQNVNRQEKNKDPEKAAKIRETNKKRQAEYRARKRSKENIPPTDLSDVTFASEDEETNQNDVSNSQKLKRFSLLFSMVAMLMISILVIVIPRKTTMDLLPSQIHQITKQRL